MKPHGKKFQTKCKKNITFKPEHGFVNKAVAILATAFFIFYGIPMPTSYASTAELVQNDRQQFVPVVSYDPNADTAKNETTAAQVEIPSGVAIQNPNPLSLSSTSLQTDGSSSPVPQLAPEAAPQLLRVIRVHAGESIQVAIDQALAGDTVFVEAGVYLQSLTLKQGVNLRGENPETTILNGQGRSEDLIIALGNNRIENLTITGGAAYSGVPYSAIRVEGDNVTIANSIIKDNLNYAVYLRSGQNTVIEKNLFLNNGLAIQHPLTTATGAVIRNNTIVGSNIGINLLSGVTPVISNNIIVGSKFASIYEFCWGRNPSRGFATVTDNVFFNNTEHGSAYGSALPPSVETWTQGNMNADPGFVDAPHGDYRLLPGAIALGKGAYPYPFVPQGQFIAGNCTQPEFRTDVTYTSCVGLVGTSNGVREIHFFNQRNNTGLTIYDLAANTQQSFTLQTLDQTDITASSFSTDGKYLAVQYQFNQIAVISLSTMTQTGTVSVPQASGHGVPDIGSIEFLSNTRALIKMADGSGREFHLDIQENGQLILTAAYLPAGWTRAASNANFAFTIQVQPVSGGYQYDLKVLNLISGDIQTIFTTVRPGSNEWPIAYDVSPDGNTVVVGIIGTFPSEGRVLLQRTDDPTRKTYLPIPSTQKIVFNADNSVTISFYLQQDGSTHQIVVDLSTFQIRVPAGWKRAASNANFAFIIQVQQVSGGYQYSLQVLNLISGDIQTIFTTVRPGSNEWPIAYDVSPDGNTVVVGIIGTFPSEGRVLLQRTDDPTRKTYLPIPSTQRIAFNADNSVTISFYLQQDGSTHQVVVDLSTFQIRVPAGWTRATSNVNFAFQITYVRVGGYFQDTLVVMNLITGVTENLISVISPAFGVLTEVYDVSPDGTTVIYGAGIAPPDQAYQLKYSVFIQHIGKPLEKLQVPGTLLSVQFDAAHPDLAALEVQRDTYTSIVTVDMKNLRVVSDLPKVPAGWTRAASNVNFAFQIAYVRVGGYFQDTLVVMNLITGVTENLISVINPAFGVITDVYDVSPDGTTVIYGAGIAPPDHAYQLTYSVFVQHIGKPLEKLQVPGTLLSVQFDAAHPDLVMLEVQRETYTSIVTVDLKDLTVVSDLPKVPAGWTRTPSNPNFAFQVQWVRGGGYWLDQVWVKNLMTGQDTMLHSNIDFITEISPVADVSADGTTAVYSYRTTQDYGPYLKKEVTIVRRINDPFGGLVFDGFLQSEVVNPDQTVTLTIVKDGVSRQVILDRRNFQIVPPQGWTVVPSMPNLAYQKVGEIVKVMDLVTAVVSERPSSQNMSTSTTTRTGLRYAITSEGLREIYYVNERGNTSIQIYNPVTSTWFGNGYSVPSFTPSDKTMSISPDGKYLLLAHQYNRLTVVSLSSAVYQKSILAASSITEVRFTAARTANVYLDNGRTYVLTILADGSLVLKRIK